MEKPPQRVWTVGHSTRSASEFIQILVSQKIESLVDVRTFPSSRRYPHFNREELNQSLALAGIEYQHVAELGGRRAAKPDSKNTAWKNVGFRGYADHMETAEFEKGIEQLGIIAREKNAATMCAEAVWWRCHRSLIADYLRAAGVEVVHILGEGQTQVHPYTTAARIIEGKLSYEGLFAGGTLEKESRGS